MSKEIVLLHISLIEGIGPISVKKVLENISQDLDLLHLYSFKKIDFMGQFGLSEGVSQKLVYGLKDTSSLEKEVNLIAKNNITFVTLFDKEYPEILKNIYAPPPVLYIKSKNKEVTSQLLGYKKKIAFVGSRKAHRYGEQVIENIIPPMVQNNWIIISGGAIGADSMAHRETVKAGGKTVAIIGSGLLNPYPNSNKRLFEEIVDAGGALVSPFRLETVARPGNFPARNRIIAGLSLGCVVIQAAKKSGASITAQFALEQGREVFAVPGPIGDELSLGCHNLIQQGAKLISCADDIFVEFGDENTQLCQDSQIKIDFTKTNKNIEKIVQITKISQSLEKSSKILPKYKPGTIENIVFTCCKDPCSIDEIAVVANKQIHELHEILFDMQLTGAIKQNHAGMFEWA